MLGKGHFVVCAESANFFPLFLQHLGEKAYPMLLDLLLTVTLFRTSLSVSFFAMLGLLVVSKCFHWLVNKRVEYMGQFPMTPLSHYVRLGVFMVILLTIDVLVVCKSVEAVMIETKGFSTLFSDGDFEGPSIHVLYGFEFSLLATSIACSMVHSALILWELLRHEGSWDSKSTYLMYADFVADVIHFVLYVLFFLTLYAHVGLPITLIRPLMVAFANFRKRVADLMRYRQATENMEQRFPEATTEELAGAHNMCIICREDMNQGRKLPCGHVLHLRCLREWLEHQQTCPTCRVPVVSEPNAAVPPNGRAEDMQNAHNPFAAAAGLAPVQGQLPPQGPALPINGYPMFNYFYGLGPFGPMPPLQPGQQPPHQPHDAYGNVLQPQGYMGPYAPAARPQWFQEGEAVAPQPQAASPFSPSPNPLNPLNNSGSTTSPTLTQQNVSTPQSPVVDEMETLMRSVSPGPALSASSSSHLPEDVARDIRELTNGIYTDLDSIRSRVDILMALLNEHGISHDSAQLQSSNASSAPQ